MKTLMLWIILGLFLVGSPHARAQTILPVPFICEWANTSGGCPAGNWLQSANCGPTSVLMVASAYNNTTPTADQINQMDDWLYAQYGTSQPPYGNPVLNNYLGYGTTTTELAGLAAGKLFGLTQAVPYTGWTISWLQQELANGYPVIIYVLAQMDIAADKGHYMVLRGMDSQNVYVNDPGLQFGGQRSATDTTPARAYPISRFSAAWAVHNNSGVSIHPNTQLPAQWLTFVEGNPGVPGDFRTISAATTPPPFLAPPPNVPGSYGYQPSPPYSLAQVTDGITLTSFPAFQNILVEIDNPGAGPNCRLYDGGVTFILPSAGSITVNGVLGSYAGVSKQYLESFLPGMNSYRPGCNIQLLDLSVVRVIMGNGPWPTFTSYLPTLDAFAIGNGQGILP